MVSLAFTLLSLLSHTTFARVKESLENAGIPEGWGDSDIDINDPKYKVYGDDDDGTGEEMGEEQAARTLSFGEVVDITKNVVDLDGNGIVTVEEMKDASLRMRKIDALRNAKEEIEQGDKDGDGFLSLDELFAFYELGSVDEEGNPKEMTEEDRKTAELVKELYDALKQDDRGFSSLELAKVFMPQLYPDALSAVSKAEFKVRDENGDGMLSEEEFFLSEVTEKDTDEQKAAILREFHVIDTDKSETISLQEFHDFIGHDRGLGEGISELMSEVDADASGTLSLDEISARWEQMGSHPIVQDWYTTSGAGDTKEPQKKQQSNKATRGQPVLFDDEL